MIQPPNWSPLHEVKQGLSPSRERRQGVLDRAWQPIALIGDPPPLQEHSRSAEERSPDELCPFLEPRANWTLIQVDLHSRARARTSFWDTETKTLRPRSPDRCLVQTQHESGTRR